jgi:hypothetical protein
MAQQASTGGRRADSITTPRVGIRTPMRTGGSVPHPAAADPCQCTDVDRRHRGLRRIARDRQPIEESSGEFMAWDVQCLEVP